MAQIVKFTVPLTPVSKKNHQQILTKTVGHRKVPFVAPSPQYRQYAELAARYIPQPKKPIDIAVNVKCVFYMPTKRRVDLTNLLEAIDDVMVKAGLLADDDYKVIASHDGSRVLYDKENPRTEVTIEEAEPNDSN